MNDYERMMNQLHVGTLLKALSISKDVHEITIGPNRPDDMAEKLQDFENKKEKSSPTTNFRYNYQNDLLSHSIKHMINNLDRDRSKQVQVNMEKRLEKFSQFENHLKNALQKDKENLQKDIKTKILWEENQIFQQMKEHEQKLEEEQIRQEQIIINRNRKRKMLLEEEKQLSLKKEAELKKIQEEEQKKKKEIRAKLFEKLFSVHQDFTKEYTDILETARNSRDEQQFKEYFNNSKQLSKMKHLSEQMDLLLKQCKDGDVNESDVNTAGAILDQLKRVSMEITEFIKKMNMAKMELAPKDNSNQKAIEGKFFDLSKVKVQNVTESSSSSNFKNTIDTKMSSSEKFYLSKFSKVQNYINNFNKTLENVISDTSLKKFRTLCQTSVNVPVNAISIESASHIRDKYMRLKKLLSGESVIASRTSFSASTHPQGIPYCKFLLAQKLVNQGEVVVSSKSEAAHPIASITLALWADFPDFGHLLLAHFYRRCPYLVPVILPQSEGQSNMDYYKSLGYLVDENGSVESQEKYIRRMSGLMRLFSAIIVAYPKLWDPFGIKNALDWLVAWLDQEPILDISATLLFDLLENTGYFLHLEYKELFWNLLLKAKNMYLPRVYEKTDSSMLGPVVRLEKFLSTVLNNGKIPPPNGLLRPHFWN